MKQLVILLKPLEELILSAGMRLDWQAPIQNILQAMSPIFPIDRTNKCQPPSSLLESFYKLTLITNNHYHQT